MIQNLWKFSFLIPVLWVGVCTPGFGLAQNLTFSPIPSLPVGRSPQAIAVGDWNGDGLSDLATVNGTSDDISILLGNGNGTFRSAVSFGVGKLPLALVAADMDNDGLMDLVVALSGLDQVVILRGNGQGLFQRGVSQASGTGTTFLAAHDVNGDGWRDVIAVNSGRFGYYPPFNLSVLMNDGQGGLKGPVTYENEGRDGMFPTGVLVEDLTNDAVPDLAVTWSQPSWRSANGLISILRNSGSGTFTSHKDIQAGFTLSAIHSADFDHNGLSDLVVTSLYADTVQLVLQPKAGVFEPLDPMKVGFAPVGIAIDDFNQDEELDLVIVNRDSNSLSVLVGNGDGTFRPGGHFGVGATPAAVIVADFDQDQSPDFATASTNTDGISVLLSGGGTIPLPSLSTDALFFENDKNVHRRRGETSSKIIRLSNIGLGRLRIFSMIIAGTGAEVFSLQDNTCVGKSLDTGESCTARVVFADNKNGTHHGTLTIQDNANGSPRRVTLKGITKG